MANFRNGETNGRKAIVQEFFRLYPTRLEREEALKGVKEWFKSKDFWDQWEGDYVSIEYAEILRHYSK